ncbi:uncharacterized protein FOMMEDRAFT_171146 [Fomitiporia mediterranea MF3/22]|uniref:uncharacterized protein n=1 Tax=Fomitiporia mediterranea (strain MF3/22) TaxID=694068 RepID=UPI0004409888|nr:uncharacterized protein FOMMEDRAFT_171146 [Fomitiporia mediterranea MF3/22]EJC98194.1 hypothetical protein FOMMEDRAFT_171146 [Fomitiporia mediterranea MF3/22]
MTMVTHTIACDCQIRFQSGLVTDETAFVVVDSSTSATQQANLLNQIGHFVVWAAEITTAANDMHTALQNLINNPNVTVDIIYDVLAYRAREQNLRAFTWSGDPAEQPQLKPLPHSDLQPLALPNSTNFPQTVEQFLELTRADFQNILRAYGLPRGGNAIIEEWVATSNFRPSNRKIINKIFSSLSPESRSSGTSPLPPYFLCGVRIYKDNACVHSIRIKADVPYPLSVAYDLYDSLPNAQ